MPRVGEKSRAPERIGIVGSRRRSTANDFVLLLAAFDILYRRGDVIVSGGCYKGADEFAEVIAKTRNIEIVVHKPDFDRYGIPLCYFERNTLIAEDCTVLLAVVAPDRRGGTEDTVRKALRLGKPVWLIEGPESPIFQTVRTNPILAP